MDADERPLALVLSGGGARAAYQVGVVAGIAECAGGEVPIRIVTGVSAGAINAACLAGHRGTLADAAGMLERLWLGLSIGSVFRPGTFSFAWSALRWLWLLGSGGRLPAPRVRGVLDTRPLRQTLRRNFDFDGISANLEAGRLQALGLSATSYESGRTVTFVDAAADVPTWRRAGRRAVHTRIGVDHVLASSALPLLFPAVEIEGCWFGDGAVRQTAPLAPAIHLGAGRILAISLRRGRAPGVDADCAVPGYPPPAQVLGMMFNAVFLDALDADAERLERVNRSLETLGPGKPHPDGLRSIALEVLRPSRDLGRLSADLFHCLPRSLRRLFGGLGSEKLESPDVLSYLLFERPYIERLIELGRADARAGWDRLARLLDPAGVDSTQA